MRFRCIIFLLLFFPGLCTTPLPANSQDSINEKYIDISRINLQKYIAQDVSSAFYGKYAELKKEYPALQFSKGLFTEDIIPNKFITQKIILRFRICNSSDSANSVWFFPGYFFRDIQLFTANRNRLTEIPSVHPDNMNEPAYNKIDLSPHDSATIVAAFLPVKTYINLIRPRLILPSYLKSFITLQYNQKKTPDTLTYIFSGLLLMMIFFSLANYLLGSNKEFLYYSGYAFFLGFMLFLKAVTEGQTSSFRLYLESYLDFAMQAIGIIFYMSFMKKFLETKTKYKFLYYLYNSGIVLLILSLLLYSYSYYFTDNFSLQNQTENFTKLLLLLMIVIFLVYSFRLRKHRLLWYIFWGNFMLLFFSLVSLLLIIMDFRFTGVAEIFNSSLFYFELGVFMELVFFLMGLSYKNRQQLIEDATEKERLIAANKVMGYEKELDILKAQQEERNRISADMHDELGSELTVIRLMSEIAKNKMKEQAPPEIDKISDSANEVLNKMNTIIWSMNSSNDSLENLIYYIRSYAVEYFENTSIQCKVNVPAQIQQHILPGDKRHNIFLSVKEALNNILKHSNATELKIDITLDHRLLIQIADNGKGINKDKIRQFGNGLKNMARRMENTGGTFKIENNNGTLVMLELPL